MSRLAISQGIDDVSQAGQRLVDVLGFSERVAFCAGLRDTFTTGQIDQVDFTCLRTEVGRIFLLDLHDEAAVAAGALGIHVRYADRAVVVTDFEYAIHLFLVAHVRLSHVLDIDAGILVLMDLQVDFLRVEKIANFFVIDFEERYPHRELDIFRRLNDSGENALDHTWDDTALYLVLNVLTKHGMRLSGAGLTVCENCAVVAVKYLIHDRSDSSLIYLRLCRLGVEGGIVSVLDGLDRTGLGVDASNRNGRRIQEVTAHLCAGGFQLARVKRPEPAEYSDITIHLRRCLQEGLFRRRGGRTRLRGGCLTLLHFLGRIRADTRFSLRQRRGLIIYLALGLILPSERLLKFINRRKTYVQRRR